MNTVVMMRNDAGEGSRGGKIVGHTSSGKPIYALGTSSGLALQHNQFTPKDHEEAANIHLELKKKFEDQGDKHLARGHQLMASSHFATIAIKQRRARLKAYQLKK